MQFVVEGDPFGKQRPRLGRGGRTYTPQKTVQYEKKVKEAYISAGGKLHPEEYIRVDVMAYYAPPKSTSKKKQRDMLEGFILPAKKPDGDNILKAICDSLNGVAYHDDAQVVDMAIRKRYAETPRVEVKVEPLFEQIEMGW